MDLDHRVLAGAPLLPRCRLQCQDQRRLCIGIEAVGAYFCFGVVDRGKWEWGAGRRWSEVAYALVFCVSAARARAKTRTNAGYGPKQEFVCRECESTRFKFSTLHSYTIEVLPVYPVPFPPPVPVLSSCADHLLSSYQTAPLPYPMAKPQRPLQASGHHPPRGRRSRAG